MASSGNYRYPTYVEKPALTATVYQSGEEIDWGQKFAMVTRTYIGPDNDILDMGKANKVGSGLNLGNGLSGTVQSCKTIKLDADRSKLVYTVRSKNYEGSGGEEDPNLLDETWQVTMAQMEVPLYRYCSPDAENGDEDYGNAVALNAWENETDPTLKNEFKYMGDDGEPVTLAGRTLDLAKLINSGVEARLVFYPQATLVTNCEDYKKVSNFSNRRAALNYIDDTPNDELDLTGYSWLKSSFDWNQNADGTWVLTETWIGSPQYLGDWAKGLYDKNNHWNMYELSSN